MATTMYQRLVDEQAFSLWKQGVNPFLLGPYLASKFYDVRLIWGMRFSDRRFFPKQTNHLLFDDPQDLRTWEIPDEYVQVYIEREVILDNDPKLAHRAENEVLVERIYLLDRELQCSFVTTSTFRRTYKQSSEGDVRANTLTRITSHRLRPSDMKSFGGKSLDTREIAFTSLTFLLKNAAPLYMPEIK